MSPPAFKSGGGQLPPLLLPLCIPSYRGQVKVQDFFSPTQNIFLTEILVQLCKRIVYSNGECRLAHGTELYYLWLAPVLGLHVVSHCPTSVEASNGSREELPSQAMKKDERLVGYALYYNTYSTWEGRVLFVEDLFVRAEHRSKSFSGAMEVKYIKMFIRSTKTRCN